MAKELKPIDPHEPILSTEVHWRNPSEGDLTLDKHGRELLSPLPLSPPIGYIKQPSLADQMRAMIRSEALKQAAIASGHETFEEADDFDVGDDYDPSSPYEEVFEPEYLPGSPTTPPVASEATPKPEGLDKEGEPAKPVPGAPTEPTKPSP